METLAVCSWVLVPVHILLLWNPRLRRRLLDCRIDLEPWITDERNLMRNILYLDMSLCWFYTVIQCILFVRNGMKVDNIWTILFICQGIPLYLTLYAITRYMVRTRGVPPRERDLHIEVSEEMFARLEQALARTFLAHRHVIIETEYISTENKQEEEQEEQKEQKEECPICLEIVDKQMMPTYTCHCTKKVICEKCLFTHLQTNRNVCPWCRQTFHTIHLKRNREAENIV